MIATTPNADARQAFAWLNAYADAFDVIECADEAAWLYERDNGIGASEVAILLGLSTWGSPYHLWAQKTGRITKGASDAEWLEYGRFMEAPCAARYEYRTRRELRDLGRFTILRSKAHPFLFATLDRVIASCPPPSEFGPYVTEPWMVGPGACEIKNATMFGMHDWDEDVPLVYQVQLQTQLVVTGWAWGSFGAQMPTGEFKCIDAQRNEGFIELVREKAAAFWECVKNDTWPPVDSSDWTRKALKAMYPRDTGTTVELPPEAAEWDVELQQAKEQRKLAEEHEDLLKNKFAAAMGDATFGVLPDGTRYSYKTKVTKEHVRRESISRTLLKVKS